MNNATAQSQESPLVIFGGLVAELNPADIPEGSAAICCDMDFTVGSVKTRFGIENVFAYEGSFELLNAGFGTSVADGPDEVPWSSPDNITFDTLGVYAVARLNQSITPGAATIAQVATPETNLTIPLSFSQIDASFDAALLTPGNSIVVGVTHHLSGGTNTTSVATVTDTAGNAYSLVVRATPGSNESGAEIWRADNINPCASFAVTSVSVVGGSTTYHGTFTGGGGSAFAGQQWKIAGFGIGGNNITGAVVTSSATTLLFSTTTQANETHAATATQFNITSATFNVTGTGNIIANIEAYETSPLLAVDQKTAVTNAATTATPAVGPVTPSSASEFCIALLSFAATTSITQGAGWTQDNSANGASFLSQIPVPTSAITGDWTLGVSEVYSAVIATFPGTGPTITPVSKSELLKASAYAATVPLTSELTGLEVIIKGKQSAIPTGATLTIVPLTLNNPAVARPPFQLGLTDGSVIIGSPTDQWGQFWTPNETNNPLFGFAIQATAPGGTPITFDISAVQIKPYFTPPNIGNFNFVGTFEMTDGQILTLALDEGGVFWQEDVNNNPNVLTPFYTAIEPNTFAKGVTVDDREFIALSDLMQGTDMPRQYNAQWLDRVSQVGPGVPPSFSATSTEYTIVDITQPAAVVNGSLGNPIRALLWSTGPGVKWQAGTVITVEYTLAPAAPDPNIYAGGGVVLSGFDVLGSDDPNGSYIVISVQQTNTGNGLRNSFSVQAPHVGNRYHDPQTGSSYQATIATMTLSAPAAGIQVGSQVLIAGTSVANLDESWTILNALNAAQLNITATSLTSNIATYNFTLISGTTPAVGEIVTVTGTTNGNGIFNLVNGIITAASPSSFSIEIDAPDVAAAAESGAQAIINGTKFQFDAAPTWVGTTPTSPLHPFIFGTSTGGTIVQPGQLGAGPRRGVVLFLTRNGYLTAPSPFVEFTLNAGANSIVASNIPVGPPNVIARVIALTGASGGFYFWIPQPVTVTSNGQLVTYDATIIHDNVTTSATFNIADAVLLAASSIDTQGSNNFAQVELGSCLGFVSYSQRIFAWGEQNKVQNFINMTFDGGYVSQNPSTPIAPAGWTVDLANGAGGQLITSPIFGNSYYIHNTTGMTQAVYGLISQTAFQDQLATPILEVQKQYGVRVTARCPSGVSTGNLIVDLFSKSFNRVYGSFSIPFASMSDVMKIFTGPLLTTAFTTQVPSDLMYRIYASQIPDGGDVELDRTEPFDTAAPVLTTQLRGSYFNNFEAFDGVTGDLGVAVENQQEVRNVFELFDNLYIVKTASFVETTDNGITEPDGWTVKEVSNKVGTPSINGVDVGEGWALVAGEPGVYLFEGGKPQKISPEIDPLWQAINWTFGKTLWIRNNTNERRILIGIPLATPNKWMPQFPVNANPTKPNVVLMCSYKELMTASALASEGAIRQGYTGQLRSFQLGRRWSAWSIEAAYADFIKRPDQTAPAFFCGDTNTGKIYQQITGNYFDDGAEILDLYVSYPFLQTQQAQQIHAGLHELLATFASMLVVGEGNIDVTILPDTLTTPYGDALPPIALGNPPAWGDTEFPLNEVGNRFFVWFETKEPGDWFELSRFVMTVTENPWAPTRGGN